MASDHMKKKVSAASARAHTRLNTPKSTSFPAMIAPIAVALTVGKLDFPGKKLNTNSRHSWLDSSKDLNLPTPQELIEELRIYFLFFDRAGYGDSDPNPSRSVKSEAYDVQELADKLQIGSKFYVIGISMGAYPVYSCLKYIPERLAGASLVVPFVNYWWLHLPANLSNEAFKMVPFIKHSGGNLAIFSPSDLEILKKWSEAPSVDQEKIRQQGVYESLHRDIMVSNRYISEKLPWIHYHEVPDVGHLLIFESKNCEVVLRELLQM
ncbi:Alpha/beta-Hydrolases superfamily protein isoform 2 [Hibiscus syriacus]|uniref:Alpha/beta-Hydrolases superfamily protein isoform 2 n=1 Tax=Hibiscus syriacus TaxID=106335 RepID=A0A6A3B3X4_HIBSY|nr:Alpha/beta-Hydrolases superfamily protein isoform 2 [Hibiscus syriacus]